MKCEVLGGKCGLLACSARQKCSMLFNLHFWRVFCYFHTVPEMSIWIEIRDLIES